MHFYVVFAFRFFFRKAIHAYNSRQAAVSQVYETMTSLILLSLFRFDIFSASNYDVF